MPYAVVDHALHTCHWKIVGAPTARLQGEDQPCGQRLLPRVGRDGEHKEIRVSGDDKYIKKLNNIWHMAPHRDGLE
eukprot:scaffold54825_cov34-Tisochrysis_lutea.AAC.1